MLHAVDYSNLDLNHLKELMYARKSKDKDIERSMLYVIHILIGSFLHC